MYAGKEGYAGQMMKEYRSDDKADCVIVFDRDPANEWPLKVKIVVLAGRPVVGMPLKDEDISLQTDIGKDESSTSWYICFGGVREQRDVTIYGVLPFLVEMDAERGEVLWCPCPEDVERVKIRMEYARKEFKQKDDPRLEPMKFRMYTYQDVKPQNMMRNYKERIGNAVNRYIKFPETAIMRYTKMNQARVKTFIPVEMRRVIEPEGPSQQSSTDVNKIEASPERERKGKPVVGSTPRVGVISQEVAAMPAVTAPRQAAATQAAIVQAADVSVGRGYDDGDSDDPDMDHIKIQRRRVMSETERLAWYQSDFARMMAMQRRKR